MNNLNKKQKIILGIIASVAIAGICYYVYARDSSFSEENLEIAQSQEENLSYENMNTNNETNSETIIVHISGAVNNEGIVELKENSRIQDAIDKAGGLKENACIDKINLAYILEDGMKICIPTIEEQKKKDEIEQESKNSTEGSSESKQNIKVNINTATQTQLETLPGIGPSTALKIINYRNEKGKFKTIEEIKEVSGIGESKFNNIKDLITI